jgi:cellulose synthase/poly-beta-1,6-N-acetylglucosamine synthase-like glycosyltransferase
LSIIIKIVDQSVLIYFVLLNSVYGILLVIAIFELYKRYGEVETENLERVLKSESIPPITILVPAFNEESNIVEAIKATLKLNYRKIQVIVINDGSTDDTMGELTRAFDLKEVPLAIPIQIEHKPIKHMFRSGTFLDLTVIDKENGGKADSLNAAINACKTPFFMAMDADTVVEKDALQRMIRPVLSQPNVVAACGSVRIANSCMIETGEIKKVSYPSNYWAGIQVIEYLRAFLFGRLGWNKLGGNLVVSGAFGLFDRSVVVDAGGYRTDTMGEDMELTVRLHKHMRNLKKPYHIEFIPDPVVWTEAPENFRVLSKQRSRWHCGLIETLVMHKDMFLNPKYGKVGMISFPFFVLGEMLSPIIEAIGILWLLVSLAMGRLDSDFAISFFVVAWGFGGMLSLFAVLLEESSFSRYKGVGDVIKMYSFLLLENLGYRQLTVVMRLKGFYKYFTNDKSWGAMSRKGLSAQKKK